MPEAPNAEEEVADERESQVNRTLFVRGFPNQTTEDELYELFLQAGPLEKVTIPQNKNMAFVLYKHSVSVPYAKEVFCDTKLHGRMLNVDFRTGSMHSGAGNQRQPQRQSSYSGNREQRHDDRSPYTNRSNQSHQHSRNSYGSPAQQNGQFASPMRGYNMPQSPFMASPQSIPAHQGIQGYRSSADNREYVPEYVSFDRPPTNFMGSVPINSAQHHVGLDQRRQRLLNQQRYVTQADVQRQARYSGQRR